MNCRDFRQQHGDWVDDMVNPNEADRLARHLVECAACARFDTLARRALLVARNAPPIEVSADFSTRLAARLAEERRARIAQHEPSHVERSAVFAGTRGVWIRRAATVALMAGGTLAARAALSGPTTSAVYLGDDAAASASYQPTASFSSLQSAGAGQIIVLSPVRQIAGTAMPMQHARLLGGADLGMHEDVSATTVAATAPLWPTAHMAAHAAHRFAAMEFGDVMPVRAVSAAR